MVKIVFKGKWLDPIKEEIVERLRKEFKEVVGGKIVFYPLKNKPAWNTIAGFHAPGYYTVEPPARYDKVNHFGFSTTLRMGELSFGCVPYLLDYVVKAVKVCQCSRCEDFLSEDEVFVSDENGRKFCRECAGKLFDLI